MEWLDGKGERKKGVILVAIWKWPGYSTWSKILRETVPEGGTVGEETENASEAKSDLTNGMTSKALVEDLNVLTGW